jgi:hypothetical protein
MPEVRGRECHLTQLARIAELARNPKDVYLVATEEKTMSASKTVPASKFTRNFGRYRMRAQREFKRFRDSRRSFATADLPDTKVKAISASRMDARHKHLDKLLDTK